MPSKIIQKNLEYLQSIGRRANEDIRDRVNQVIQFYRDRKISQRETTKKFINDLMSDKKITMISAKKRFDKKYEQIEGRAPLNKRMTTNKNKRDYIITFQFYGDGETTPGKVAFKDDQGKKHNLLNIPQPIQFNFKNVKDEDKLNEILVGKYILRDGFDLWTTNFKRKLNLKKGNNEKINRKEFDELNNREAWRKEMNIPEEPRKKRNMKGKYKEFEILHQTNLFETLFKKLIMKNKELISKSMI